MSTWFICIQTNWPVIERTRTLHSIQCILMFSLTFQSNTDYVVQLFIALSLSLSPLLSISLSLARASAQLRFERHISFFLRLWSWIHLFNTRFVFNLISSQNYIECIFFSWRRMELCVQSLMEFPCTEEKWNNVNSERCLHPTVDSSERWLLPNLCIYRRSQV